MNLNAFLIIFECGLSDPITIYFVLVTRSPEWMFGCYIYMGNKWGDKMFICFCLFVETTGLIICESQAE